MPLEVNNCCFFIELRTGSLIIGYLNLIWNVILTGLLIASLVVAGNADKPDNNAATAVQLALIVIAIALVFVLMNIVFSALLLVGIYKNVRGYVKAYLIYTGIFLVFAVISVGTSIGQGASATDIIRNIFSLLFSIYYLIVVRSYFLKMDYAPPMMTA